MARKKERLLLSVCFLTRCRRQAVLLPNAYHLTSSSASFLISFFILCRELDHNDISGTIEDTNGAFGGLENLNKL